MDSKSSSGKKHEQMSLDLGLHKRVELAFDGELVSSDGGLLLLRKADEKLRLTELVSQCIGDERRSDYVKHKTVNLLRQRIYSIAAGYEDCNDAKRLRDDGMHRLAAGHLPHSERGLGSQPTLSRFENSVDAPAIKAIQSLLIYVWIQKLKKKGKRPRQIRLSMDTTCDVVHGYQQLTFYNGFYETACYTPLFIFAEDGFPLAAELRPGNAGTGEGAVRNLSKIVDQIRKAFGNVPIELTADAGFAWPEIFNYCESNGITYFIAAAGHSGFQYHSEELVVRCRNEFESLAGSALVLKKYGQVEDKKARDLAWRQKEERIRFSSKEEGRMQEHFEEQLRIRKFDEFTYAAREWGKDRRVVFRVEFTCTGPDVRYVVTNKVGCKARELYEDRYCKRAQCENWIKDLKTYLKCDRTSCQEWTANQFRLLLHVLAYMLMCEIRNAAKKPFITMETVRIQFLKIGVIVREQAYRVHLKLAREHPWSQEFELAWKLLG